MPKILIVDDDRELCLVVAHSLTKEQHVVELAHNADEGLHRMLSVPYDLVILDLSIADKDGMEVCKEFRAQGGLSRILMLTGRDSFDSKAEGLDCGADDYVTKPFNIKELVARVRAVLRRPIAVNPAVIRMGKIELNTTNHTIRKDGRLLQCLPVDFALLAFLMKHCDEVYSGDALISRVWNTDKEVSSDALRSSIKRIRQLIDDEGCDSMIETVPRVGYVLRSPGP